ncbi:MAG: carbamoyl-phosphate synthase large subunit, partial [Nitrospinota bacterium]
ELIGAKLEAIQRAEDRDLFKAAMEAIGLAVPQSGYASSREEALAIIQAIPYPVIIRPSFTLGGTGGNVAHDEEEFAAYVEWGLNASPFSRILIEESVLGWKEFELEVMRDLKDNVVIICSIENFDPMGIHTGDSITVAPAQTLTDKEYQIMRDAAVAIIRAIGVETGGSNIQFAVHPETGELVVIEMNPRVSRSSALASKATGFPIAKMAAKLAVGLTLDEIPNDITKETPASFEPTIDYCVVKFPRFAFEKFPEADQTLTTQMKSVGEVMAIGRTFKEALLKAVRSLEIDRYALTFDGGLGGASDDELVAGLVTPNWERVWAIAEALKRGWPVEDCWRLTKIDPWFLANIADIVAFEVRLGELRARWVAAGGRPEAIRDYLTPDVLREAKALGVADALLARLFATDEVAIRELRRQAGVAHTFKLVDTCGAEFEAYTPYLYSTYERECEAAPSARRKILILGSGPNRIGQGIEFDYCCVHGVFALKDDGFETIMVNCNPETVSTDYDTSDRLYFEPLTLEDALNIIETERPEGVIVQFGGQTPLKLAIPLERAGVRIIGTSPEAIDRAEDRERFKALVERLGLKQPDNGTATSFTGACAVAQRIGYPVVVRPSKRLGGRALEIG